jgi:hypothetical protein
MSFLQPILLAALPLISLPIVIHLINQRRFRTIRWAGMMFLLAANRMSRGYARLRQILILLFRTIAVAGLIFAVSRPLASGWLGRAAGSRPDTTITLLDRSPSMRQQSPGSVISKLDAGRHQLAQTLAVLGSGRWVLIENTTKVAQEIEGPESLLKLPATEPAGTSADLPAMLEAARDYIRDNRAGRTEIWICSDVRQNDWNAESVRWQALRTAFQEFPQSIRFHLLAYPDPAQGNISVRVTEVRRQQSGDGAELLLSLKLAREGGAEEELSLPVQFEIEGARSELTVKMNGPTFELKDHRIPIERSRERGWGKVSIPADANPADNEYFFVFDQPQPRRALLVSDDAVAVAPLQLAASTPPDPAIRCSAEVIKPEQIATADWDGLALLIWHAPLPTADAAKAIEAFVQRGGQVLFLPPRSPGDAEFMGVRWQGWSPDRIETAVETWRGDQDILANTQSGAALPVGQLQIRRHCGISGEMTILASLKSGQPLLTRLPTNRGGVYFCTTTPESADSSFARNGVVLYVLVQRALAAGAAARGQTRQLIAGESATEYANAWQQLAGSAEALSTDYPHHAGVYQAGDKLLAINRAPTEDQAPVLSNERVAELFNGLDFTRVDDQAGPSSGLIQEIWRLFLVAMMIALLVEAGLCLPKKAKEPDRLAGRLAAGPRGRAVVESTTN